MTSRRESHAESVRLDRSEGYFIHITSQPKDGLRYTETIQKTTTKYYTKMEREKEGNNI